MNNTKIKKSHFKLSKSIVNDGAHYAKARGYRRKMLTGELPNTSVKMPEYYELNHKLIKK